MLTAPAVEGVLDPVDDGVGELVSGPPAPSAEDVLLHEGIEGPHGGVVARGPGETRPIEPRRTFLPSTAGRASREIDLALSEDHVRAVRLPSGDRLAERLDRPVRRHPIRGGAAPGMSRLRSVNNGA